MTTLSFYGETALDLTSYTSLYIVQDGGFFYIFEDARHSNDYDREPLAFYTSSIDPVFGDFKAAKAARHDCAKALLALGINAATVWG